MTGCALAASPGPGAAGAGAAGAGAAPPWNDAVGGSRAAGPSGDSGARSGITRLMIIRHGETLWNKEGKMQGHLDIALNDVGREQAKEVARALRQLGLAGQVDAVVSSDLARASETADLIVDGACPLARRVIDEGLREMNFGSLTGKKSGDPEHKAVKQGVLQAWKHGNFSQSFPEGESGESLLKRGMKSLRAAANLGSCVLVVGHGGMIRWSAAALKLCDSASVDELFLLPPEEAKVAMAQPEVQELVSAPVRNCCCSTVLFDHNTGAFKPVAWYQSLHGDESAKDDTG